MRGNGGWYGRVYARFAPRTGRFFTTTQFVCARVLFASELISDVSGGESACKVAIESTIMELDHSSSCQSPDLVENVSSYWQ